MTQPRLDAFTRRAFLWRGLTLASASATVPAFLSRSAWAMADPDGAMTSSRPGVPEDRILVVVQLGGGNDGLNTVVPFADPAYARARPGIGVGSRDVLRLQRAGAAGAAAAESLGLHPALADLKGLYDEGLLSIVQGVGYPNPNRSHFASMDIWQTADERGTGDGWLGRYFDNTCAGAPDGSGGCSGQAGIALGRAAPLAMQGRSFRPVSFESPDLFSWSGAGRGGAEDAAYRMLSGAGDGGGGVGAARHSEAEFLVRTALDARLASERIRTAVEGPSLVSYPDSPLGRQLAMVGAMIRAGLSTRVYYVSMTGFDTHAGQGGVQGQHGALLRRFAEALAAFSRDLRAQGNDGRVLTMTFSEFGRRVGQNASGGTDHGTAAPMFLMGPMVRAGVLGEHPSLTDLDEGDLKHTVDFRSVYAGVLGGWMRADAAAVLGRRFPEAKLLRRV